MTLAEIYPTVARMLRFYCHANDLDLSGLREQVHKEKWLTRNPLFRDDFDQVTHQQIVSPDDHCALTGLDYETAEEVAEQLRMIFDFICHDGPHS